MAVLHTVDLAGPYQHNLATRHPGYFASVPLFVEREDGFCGLFVGLCRGNRMICHVRILALLL
jgi:hypothetical protein